MRDKSVEGQAKRSRLVQAVSRACDLLGAFRLPGEALRLRDLVSRTGLRRATAHRLLLTLEERGLIEREGPLWRSRLRPHRLGRYRIAYAELNSGSVFSQEVTTGLVRVAREEDVYLHVFDNRYSAKTALRNADLMVKDKPDLIIEVQIEEKVAPIIASKFLEAGIPFISVGVPLPGGIFYGVDNYKAGLVGGRHLGNWVKQHWGGAADELILLDVMRAGPSTRSRLVGVHDALIASLPGMKHARVVRLDGDGLFSPSVVAMRNYLRYARSEHTLVGAVNDPSSLGAVRAFEEVGRAHHCAVVGFDATLLGRTELRKPGSHLVGSITFFPEHYGAELIRLAIDVLDQKRVPPAVFGKYQLVTRDNVNHLYPNDELLSNLALESMLLRSPRAAK